jgi:beta-glucuronidase
MTVAGLAVLVALISLGPADGAARAASAPTRGALYLDGPDGRYLLGGQWLFRLDRQDVGLGFGFASNSSRRGWSTVTVPNAWNATDQRDASMAGSVGWYRRDFRVPDAAPALAWIVRFESVNFSAQVWLNGRLLGSNVGAYLPFEFRLANLNRRGTNRLVIRVDNRLSNQSTHPQPPRGWWNYGGLLGEVYLRRVDRLDFERVAVRPTLPCPSCSARIETHAAVRNYSSATQRVHVKGVYGPLSLDLGVRDVQPGAAGVFVSSRTLAHPKLWAPGHPNLYRMRLIATAVTASGGGAARGRNGRGSSARPSQAAGYTVLSGVRSITVTRSGELLLNGRAVHFRGVAVHEDNPFRGAAINNSDRAQIIVSAGSLGATLIRAHYPLHPQLEELADRAGILLWSEIPVYQLGEKQLGEPAFANYGRAQLQANILANQNHPSVVVWSIGNELPTMPGPAQTAYISSQARLAKHLDPSRPVGLPVAVNPLAGCQTAAYAPLNVLGLNDYFGWYTGSQGSIADRDALSSYLDSIRACYPSKALAITEFGAEANRPGPVEEKGTYAFQSDFVSFHLAAYGSKPWLAGAAYFTLQEFRVEPGWIGGDPWPNAPIHQKGLISFAGVPKPAYYVVRQLYRATRQYG